MNSHLIGKKLKKLRIEKNVDRDTVATATGLTASAISNYENGIRIPRDEAKVALAQYYGVSIGEIFFDL